MNNIKKLAQSSTTLATAVTNLNTAIAAAITAAAPQVVVCVGGGCTVSDVSDGSAPSYTLWVNLSYQS